MSIQSNIKEAGVRAGILCIVFLVLATPAGGISDHHHDKQKNSLAGRANGEKVRFSPEFRYSCVYDNQTYPGGHKFKPDPCTFCRCPRLGGRPKCAIQDCYREPSCVRYNKPKDECCGVCIEFGCLHSDGKSYAPGAVVLKSACEKCICPEEGGRTVCEKVSCAPVSCVNPYKEEGQCCHTCPDDHEVDDLSKRVPVRDDGLDLNIKLNNTLSPDTGPNCWLEGRVLKAGKTVNLSGCRRCNCPETSLHNRWIFSTTGEHQPIAICTIDDCD